MEDNRKNSTEEQQQWDDYVLRIADICESIPLHKVTILTGRNGGGKSMIRKLMPAYMAAREELQDRTGSIVASISMDLRAGINPERGFMSMFDRDIEWFPTSENTFTSVEGLLKQTDRFLVLDELELGMGEELQAGLAMWINERLSDVLEKNLGILVITHSRTMVKYLQHDGFINLEGMTEEQWISRDVVPMRPEELQQKSRDLYNAFEKRIKRK